MHVEKAGGHVDRRAVGQIALHVHHVDGIGDVRSLGRHRVDEPLGRHPLAAEMAAGIGDRQLDGVNIVLGNQCGDVNEALVGHSNSCQWGEM